MKVYRSHYLITPSTVLKESEFIPAILSASKLDLARCIAADDQIETTAIATPAGTEVHMMVYAISPSRFMEIKRFIQKRLSPDDFDKFNDMLKV